MLVEGSIHKDNIVIALDVLVETTPVLADWNAREVCPEGLAANLLCHRLVETLSQAVVLRLLAGPTGSVHSVMFYCLG